MTDVRPLAKAISGGWLPPTGRGRDDALRTLAAAVDDETPPVVVLQADPFPTEADHREFRPWEGFGWVACLALGLVLGFAVGVVL